MPSTSLGITYPSSGDHTRLWEHFQTLAEDVDGLLSGLPLVQSGTAVIPFSGQNTSSVAVTFAEPFGARPNVTVTSTNVGLNCSNSSASETGFTAFARRLEGATQGTDVTVDWIAVGPRP